MVMYCSRVIIEILLIIGETIIAVRVVHSYIVLQLCVFFMLYISYKGYSKRQSPSSLLSIFLFHLYFGVFYHCVFMYFVFFVFLINSIIVFSCIFFFDFFINSIIAFSCIFFFSHVLLQISLSKIGFFFGFGCLYVFVYKIKCLAFHSKIKQAHVIWCCFASVKDLSLWLYILGCFQKRLGRIWIFILD